MQFFMAYIINTYFCIQGRIQDLKEGGGGLVACPQKLWVYIGHIGDFFKQLSNIGGHLPPGSTNANYRGQKLESVYLYNQVTWIDSYNNYS